MKKTDISVPGVDPSSYPKHIAFIMDGNGRWAQKRYMPRTVGHTMGAKQFKNIVSRCRNLGIQYITFYAFSTENWKRPEIEVSAILKLLQEYMVEVRKFFSQETKLLFIGNRAVLDPELRAQMEALENDTKDFDKMTLLIAFNYGSREEIVHSTKEIIKEVTSNKLNIEDIDEKCFNNHLYTKDIPDVDLLIRPSGEYRISNFLLWQCAYAEFYFTDVLWPDFNKDELDKAIISFAGRKRRFGGI
jgi:undecaprenyl diphosphate synthase